jgi:3-oxoacyl-[acyl-carrier-protein] synthase II
MNILGIGTIFSGGAGIDSFEEALRRGWRMPGEIKDSRFPGVVRPVYQVDLDAMPDKTLLKKIRRSDKLSKMSVLAAAGALTDSGIENVNASNLGVIVATAFGAHATTFAFLDDILDYGEAAVSPTTFSNSVHNAAASYVSSSLSIKGPTLTITQFRFSFQTAMQLAKTWLDQGRCDHVLVGAVDQYGDVLGYVSDHKLNTAKDGRIKPFTFKPACQVPGEGAAFYLLGPERRSGTYCAVETVEIGGDRVPGSPPDIEIIDADGMLADESAYREALSRDVPAAAYAPLFGSMMTGSAFNVAAGALMLRNQMQYATPVQDNPHGLRLLTETRHALVESIRCTGFNCYAEKAVTSLTRV